MMLRSILLTGTGGQGVVTMASLITAHLQENNLKVTLIHATGMAQRGGRVTSEIRFSDDKNLNFGPRISTGGADFIIGMDLAETVNSIAYMKKGGCLLCNDYTLIPSQVILKKGHFPNAEEVQDLFKNICRQVQLVKAPHQPVNMFVLGEFIGICTNKFESKGIFTPDTFEATLKKKLIKRIDENLTAYRNGVTWSRKGHSNV